jgi:hypothetical protein
MLVNFKIENKVLNDLGILNGIYDTFSIEWYRRVGASYSMTMLINAFMPLSEIA